jgi:hypothetical protein
MRQAASFPEKAKVPIPSSHELPLRRDHSARKVCIGSIHDPRSAGTQTAIRATELNRIGTVMNTAGSQLFTPNKKLAIRWVRVNAPPVPKTAPASAKHIPCHITTFRIFWRSAPRLH